MEHLRDGFLDETAEHRTKGRKAMRMSRTSTTGPAGQLVAKRLVLVLSGCSTHESKAIGMAEVATLLPGELGELGDLFSELSWQQFRGAVEFSASCDDG